MDHLIARALALALHHHRQRLAQGGAPDLDLEALMQLLQAHPDLARGEIGQMPGRQYDPAGINSPAPAPTGATPELRRYENPAPTTGPDGVSRGQLGHAVTQPGAPGSSPNVSGPSPILSGGQPDAKPSDPLAGVVEQARSILQGPEHGGGPPSDSGPGPAAPGNETNVGSATSYGPSDAPSAPSGPAGPASSPGASTVSGGLSYAPAPVDDAPVAAPTTSVERSDLPAPAAPTEAPGTVQGPSQASKDALTSQMEASSSRGATITQTDRDAIAQAQIDNPTSVGPYGALNSPTSLSAPATSQVGINPGSLSKVDTRVEAPTPVAPPEEPVEAPVEAPTEAPAAPASIGPNSFADGKSATYDASNDQRGGFTPADVSGPVDNAGVIGDTFGGYSAGTGYTGGSTATGGMGLNANVAADQINGSVAYMDDNNTDVDGSTLGAGPNGLGSQALGADQTGGASVGINGFGAPDGNATFGNMGGVDKGGLFDQQAQDRADAEEAANNADNAAQSQADAAAASNSASTAGASLGAGPASAQAASAQAAAMADAQDKSDTEDAAAQADAAAAAQADAQAAAQAQAEADAAAAAEADAAAAEADAAAAAEADAAAADAGAGEAADDDDDDDDDDDGGENRGGRVTRKRSALPKNATARHALRLADHYALGGDSAAAPKKGPKRAKGAVKAPSRQFGKIARAMPKHHLDAMIDVATKVARERAKGKDK